MPVSMETMVKPARRNQADRDPNPISKPRSGSSECADGEQCAPVLVKVHPGLMTANLRSPTFSSDGEAEGMMVDPVNSASRLRDLRDSIDNIDAAIVHMLAERFRCTRAVGALKAQHGLHSAT
jgi:hypothetical protein